MTTINVFDQSTHKKLVNGNTRNGFVNILTVFFTDGDTRIEEIHQSSRNNMSRFEWDGQACSVELPEVVFEHDIAAIADELQPLVKAKNWNKIRDIVGDITQHVNFYDDYIDGSYEDCETNEEMENHIAKHGYDVAAIREEILNGGASYVDLDGWIENWIDNKKCNES